MLHGLSPSQQMQVPIIWPDLDDPRKVHCHHGGNVGQAELLRGDEFTAFKPRVQIHQKLPYPRQATFCQLRDLCIVDWAWQGSVGQDW